MQRVSVTHEINAPPPAVWAVLTDPVALVESGTGITRLEGEIAADARFKLTAAVSPNRAFAIHVTAFEPPKRMVWKSGMPLGLFGGERVFDLAPSKGGTRLIMSETFRGLLLPLIWRSMPDLHPSFETFVHAVAARAESETP
ncbi:MAG: SRPBCC domain-containing protein [Pseudomonadota bacterium]